MVNYYEILEIDSSATDREVKSAFRRLAKKYHPDVNQTQGATEVFKKVYMAYEVLSDPYKKQLYDEMRGTSGGYSQTEETADASNFNYDSGFSEWERRAGNRAEYYANMRYEQFREEELHGADFFFHQIALFLGLIALYAIGVGGIYFAKTVITAVMEGKVPFVSVFGALLCFAFGVFVLWQGIKITRVFFRGFARKFSTKKE